MWRAPSIIYVGNSLNVKDFCDNLLRYSLFIALQSLSYCEIENASPRAGNSPSWGKRFMSYAFRLSQVAQHGTDIGIQQNGLHLNAFHCDGFTQVDAGIGGSGILRRHAQERHFDDAGGYCRLRRVPGTGYGRA